jgi:lipopolysaccharide heptosyltransferase I
MNRFLIVRLGSLGDVVHGIPVAAALRHEYPTSRIDWLVDPRYVELLNLVVGLDRRIGVDPHAIKRGPARRRFRQTVRELRDTGYDAAIDLQGLLKSAMLARSVRAHQTIGFPRRHLREPLARLFYTDAPDPGLATHVIYKNLALLAPLHVTDLRVRFPLEIPRTATTTQIIHRFERRDYALVNPGAAWPNKRWPPAKFGAVAAGIEREFGWRSLVLWGPGEQELAHEVAAQSGGAAEISPPTTITDLVGLARGARLMISGDTGPLHLAAAAKTPIVSLFGPTDSRRNGSWASNDVSVSEFHHCICHYKRECSRATRCLDDISVDDVTRAVAMRLDRAGAAKR